MAEKYAEEIKAGTIDTEVMIELAAKFKKLTGKKMMDYVEGKATLEEGEPPPPKEDEKEAFKARVRKLQTKAVEKLGREKAEMVYYEVLGEHGASNIGEVFPSAYNAVLADYRSRIEHAASMTVPPDADKNQ